MATPLVMKCHYPGCGKFFQPIYGQVFCQKHAQLMIEVKKRKEQKAAESKDALPTPTPPTRPATEPEPQTSPDGASSSNSPSKRVRRGHRKQIEALKRKIAKRVKSS